MKRTIYRTYVSAISDANQQVVWRWKSEAFGLTPANEDPDGDGVGFVFNLRFAGQYYDTETGLHYNYFRYYDPRIGRYITSDPIGLNGGLNTYAYVAGNPLVQIDSKGLDIEDYEPFEIPENSDNKWYPPGTPGPSVNGPCWLNCKLRKSAICGSWSIAGIGIGTTVGAAASVLSSGVLAPAIEGFAYVGGIAAWGACTFGLDMDCNKICKEQPCS